MGKTKYKILWKSDRITLSRLEGQIYRSKTKTTASGQRMRNKKKKKIKKIAIPTLQKNLKKKMKCKIVEGKKIKEEILWNLKFKKNTSSKTEDKERQTTAIFLWITE